MSRFADPKVTRRVDLGPCECPGGPHDSDYADIRAEMSLSDIARFANTPTPEDTATEVARLVVGWNLLGPNGQPWEPSQEAVMALFGGTLTTLIGAINDVQSECMAKGNAPKDSGASSANGSREKPSRLRSAKTRS